MNSFDHESLDVYIASTQFVSHASRISADTPRGLSTLTDQLRRAAISICLNIAEGAGEYSPREKVRFYRMAKRSATECAAVLDSIRVWECPDGERWVSLECLDTGRGLLLRIVSMLVRMAKATESRVG